MDICFTDTETLGLHIKAPIWEFAAIRRTYNDDGGWYETPFHCFVHHRPQPWLKQLPDEFKVDYLARYRTADPKDILLRREAAEMMIEATNNTVIVGAVPDFDTQRIERLLNKVGFSPGWHYHKADVENMVVGYLRGKLPHLPSVVEPAFTAITKPPWKSDELSQAVGVDPKKYKRHTAMGDVEWVRDQYDAVMHNVPETQ